MQNLTFSQCFKGAWHDTAQAIVKMPLLTLILFGFSLAVFLNADQQFASMQQTAGAADSGSLASLFSVGALICVFITTARVIRLCVQGEVQRPMLAGVNRLVLLNLIYMACVTVVVVVVALAYMGLSTHKGTGTGASVIAANRPYATALLILTAVVALLIVAVVVLVAVVVRLILMTPHVVLGGTFEWRKAWRDTRGHFWRIFVTLIGILAPVVIIYVPLALGSQSLVMRADTGSLLYDAALFTSTLCYVVYTIVSAAAYAWLYKRFANTLLH